MNEWKPRLPSWSLQIENQETCQEQCYCGHLQFFRWFLKVSYIIKIYYKYIFGFFCLHLVQTSEKKEVIKLPDLSFETNPSSKLAIFTTIFRKNRKYWFIDFLKYLVIFRSRWFEPMSHLKMLKYFNFGKWPSSVC